MSNIFFENAVLGLTMHFYLSFVVFFAIVLMHYFIHFMRTVV